MTKFIGLQLAQLDVCINAGFSPLMDRERKGRVENRFEQNLRATDNSLKCLGTVIVVSEPRHLILIVFVGTQLLSNVTLLRSLI